MGLGATFKNSIVKVIAGLAGFVLFFAGGQTAIVNGAVGTIMILASVVLLVFAANA